MYSSYYTGKEVLGCKYVFFEEKNQTINGNYSEKCLWLLRDWEALLLYWHLNNSSLRVKEIRNAVWLEATITNFAVLVKQTNGKSSKRKPAYNFPFYFWWYSSYFRDECWLLVFGVCVNVNCIELYYKLRLMPFHGFNLAFHSRIYFVYLTCHPAW